MNTTTEELTRAKQRTRSEVPAAEVTDVRGLVSVQPGAVVSRTVISRDTGTVTLFAFDEDQRLSEHTASFDALAFVLEGQAEITIDGTPFELSAGEAILMPAHHPHAVHAISEFKMLLIMIRS